MTHDTDTGTVDILINGAARAPGERIAVVRAGQVLLEDIELTDDGPNQSVGQCRLEQLPIDLSEAMKLPGTVDPPDTYAEVPGAVSRLFQGIDDPQLDDLGQAVETAATVIEETIRNRSTNG